MLVKIKSGFTLFFKKYFTRQNVKNFIGPIIIAVLTISIPLLIFFCFNQFKSDSQENKPQAISVSLFDADGTLIDSATTQEDIIDTSPLANLFYQLSYSKVKAQKPAEFDKKQTMSYVITYNSETMTFKCYFEENSESSYLEDQNGSFFAPDAVAYSMLLASPYSETIYKESSPPTLCTPLDEEIIPNQAEWTYILTDGTSKISSNYKTTDEILTYRIEGSITLRFSRTPDLYAITAKTLSGETVFSGDPEDFSSFNVDENTELLISINAKWKENEDFTSYGNQHYEFKIICSKPSTFNISSKAAAGGQVLFLSVSDVYGNDTIYYSPISTLSDEEKEASDDATHALKELYSYTPIFVREGSNAYALLPIPANIPDTEFTFSLSCGISRENITLTLKKSNPTEILNTNATLTGAQKAEFSRILFYLKHSTNDVLLLNESFAFPDTYGFIQTQKYNSNINDSFTLLANSYTANNQSGISVRSANLGIVSEVGSSPLLGNYVIVDHGMGLLSWYCGLSDVSVRENDIVKKGAPIGRAGSSSLICENGVNVICSVGGILINPAELE